MGGNKLGCGFCSRAGLPILLVRPGVADRQDSVPNLPENVSPPIAAQGNSKYTGRLLREGYLHVYDELINFWKDYYVTAEGYYYPLPGNGDVPPRLLSGEMTPCISHPEELAMASLITLPVMPPPMPNGVFWFGWSENKWTPAVKKMHEDPAVRQKMMLKFDMDAWLNSGQGERALPVSQLPSLVAEYSPGTGHAEINDYSSSYFQPSNLRQIISSRRQKNSSRERGLFSFSRIRLQFCKRSPLYCHTRQTGICIAMKSMSGN